MVALEHGKVDKQILEYLMVQYQGLAKKLRDIWKKGRERELDCHALEHRLLEQVLYTGAYVGERQELFMYREIMILCFARHLSSRARMIIL